MAINPAAARLVGVIDKAPDLECHIRVVEIENVKVVELRDFIPSLGEYGRGYWMPIGEDAIYGIVSLLTEVANQEKVRQ